MYLSLKSNAHHLLSNINCERSRKEAAEYVRLLNVVRSDSGDVADPDSEFGRAFRKFWGLNYGGLNRKDIEACFGVLSDFRSTGDVQFENILSYIRNRSEDPDNGKVILSFSSKVFHMINPNEPIYDSVVGRFFLIKPTYDFPRGRRLERAIEIYQFLQWEYSRLEKTSYLSAEIDQLRETLGVSGEEYSDAKAIDTLIWTFSSMCWERTEPVSFPTYIIPGV